MNQVTAAGLIQLLDEIATYEFIFEEPANSLLLSKMVKILNLILAYQGEVSEGLLLCTHSYFSLIKISFTRFLQNRSYSFESKNWVYRSKHSSLIVKLEARS